LAADCAGKTRFLRYSIALLCSPVPKSSLVLFGVTLMVGLCFPIPRGHSYRALARPAHLNFPLAPLCNEAPRRPHLPVFPAAAFLPPFLPLHRTPHLPKVAFFARHPLSPPPRWRLFFCLLYFFSSYNCFLTNPPSSSAFDLKVVTPRAALGVQRCFSCCSFFFHWSVSEGGVGFVDAFFLWLFFLWRSPLFRDGSDKGNFPLLSKNSSLSVPLIWSVS